MVSSAGVCRLGKREERRIGEMPLVMDHHKRVGGLPVDYRENHDLVGNEVVGVKEGL